MAAEDFVKNFYQEKQSILNSSFDHQSKYRTLVSTKIEELIQMKNFENKMRFLFLSLLISTSIFGQSNNDIKSRLKTYIHLDSIDVYSKDYPTKILEGSGFITNKNKKNIGSAGFSIEITKDINNRIIRVLKSESDHYEKYDKKPQKSIISKITIYFNEFQQPDLAKYLSETFISDSLVTTKTFFFDLKENNDDIYEFRQIEDLLSTVKKEIE
ncbi:hypothetical protein [Chryseobacterium lathyri]|uniref:hypothetical protein n=1 Tax=Chryseobacterium lathyri TaxID=395933 RepID=UPI002784D3C3|nr:hypothetical protein [Chryseobacterium lathyri]MDQ0064497.1 hypothetical protein [Chryseobacterium lathyri]